MLRLAVSEALLSVFQFQAFRNREGIAMSRVERIEERSAVYAEVLSFRDSRRSA